MPSQAVAIDTITAALVVTPDPKYRLGRHTLSEQIYSQIASHPAVNPPLMTNLLKSENPFFVVSWKEKVFRNSLEGQRNLLVRIVLLSFVAQ